MRSVAALFFLWGNLSPTGSGRIGGGVLWPKKSVDERQTADHAGPSRRWLAPKSATLNLEKKANAARHQRIKAWCAKKKKAAVARPAIGAAACASGSKNQNPMPWLYLFCSKKKWQGPRRRHNARQMCAVSFFWCCFCCLFFLSAGYACAVPRAAWARAGGHAPADAKRDSIRGDLTDATIPHNQWRLRIT